MIPYYTLDAAFRPIPCNISGYFDWLDRLPEKGSWYLSKTACGLQLARDIVSGLRVSTVYLGMDHAWGLGQRPVLWETMVFDDDASRSRWDQYQDRYTSHAEAMAGHARICRLIASEGVDALTGGAYA